MKPFIIRPMFRPMPPVIFEKLGDVMFYIFTLFGTDIGKIRSPRLLIKQIIFALRVFSAPYPSTSHSQLCELLYYKTSSWGVIATS